MSDAGKAFVERCGDDRGGGPANGEGVVRPRGGHHRRHDQGKGTRRGKGLKE